MRFIDLIKSNHWLSIELTLLELYPDQNEIIDDYKTVFESLQTITPVNDEMLIVLTKYDCDNDLEEKGIKSTYVDVSGRKVISDPDSITDSYAIEFVKWEKWLGMTIAPETIDNFSELEILANCLYEMTFCGYEEDEIQEHFDSMKKTVDDYKSLTDEEKKDKTISLEEIMNKLNKNVGS